ncbi:hypothetical protein [Acidovorax sp. Root219]|uniref:hypothetical protein n=1 Tax=Acidovorax sp. Root219 TaxID=1736493 RepID=UPI00070D9606|nr:hypothetical protein [Acidovorax sp. Root219]KRC36228.1 hypothetical protein ASE28_01455 [Acidovorax sp. Root219]
MGRTISSTVDAVDQPLNITAAAAIAAGDLVKVDTGGWMRKVSDAFPLAVQNSAAGVTALVAANNPSGGSTWGMNATSGLFSRHILPMPNGEFLYSYTGNGANNLTGMNLGFFSAGGALKFKVTMSAATCGPNRVTRAGASNVAVIWSEGTVLTMGVYNATTGATVLAPVTVGTVASNSGYDWNVTTLANGDFVIAYPDSGNMVFKRFNASGVLQGAMTTAEVTQTPNFVVVLAQTGGGFIVRWAKTAAAQGQRMARFNASGVLQGSVVQITTGSNLYDGGGTGFYCGRLEGKLIEVANGNIVTTECTSLTTQSFKVYDPTLTLLTTVLLPQALSSGVDQHTSQITAKQGGGFWLASNAVVGNCMQEYDNAGNLVRTAPSSTASSVVAILDRPGAGPVTITMSWVASNSSSYSAWVHGSDFARESGTGLTVFTGAAWTPSVSWFEILSPGFLVAMCTQGSTATHTQTMGLAGAASVIGVAQEAAALGASGKVSTAGKLLMNQNLTSPAFDRRASTPPGTKGSAAGTTAILAGFVG